MDAVGVISEQLCATSVGQVLPFVGVGALSAGLSVCLMNLSAPRKRIGFRFVGSVSG